MNIHIIQDQDDNGIIAVFGSNAYSPASLEKLVLEAMYEATEMQTQDVFTTAEVLLEKQGIISLKCGGSQSWEYTKSIY